MLVAITITMAFSRINICAYFDRWVVTLASKEVKFEVPFLMASSLLQANSMQRNFRVFFDLRPFRIPEYHHQSLLPPVGHRAAIPEYRLLLKDSSHANIFSFYVNALPFACATHWSSLGKNSAPVGARLIKGHHSELYPPEKSLLSPDWP